jgi:NAD(P)-dependent dehydrogenase (short-subunit alcohol dehydrogenase family)
MRYVIVVIGPGQIGQAIARWVGVGKHVLLADVRQENADAAAEVLGNAGYEASAWPRCDAETSPDRGYYYHPSRHSAGQPIVADWRYQLIAELGFSRDSWVAPAAVTLC